MRPEAEGVTMPTEMSGLLQKVVCNKYKTLCYAQLGGGSLGTLLHVSGSSWMVMVLFGRKRFWSVGVGMKHFLKKCDSYLQNCVFCSTLKAVDVWCFLYEVSFTDFFLFSFDFCSLFFALFIFYMCIVAPVFYLFMWSFLKSSCVVWW